MSRRSLSALTFGRKYLLSNITPNCEPKNKTVKFNKNNKNRSEIITKKNSFLSPKLIYANYIIKRDCKPSVSTGDNYNKHNYSEKIEELINKQICVEFSAAQAYLNMAAYYGRSNVALPGLHGYFMKMYYEEQDHGIHFIQYQNKRGGKVRLFEIPNLDIHEWPNAAETFKCALDMEKSVTEDLIIIYKQAEKLHDTDVEHMLDYCIEEQEKSIFELSRLLTRANLLANNEIGKYLLDRELHKTHVQKDTTTFVAELGPKLYK